MLAINIFCDVLNKTVDEIISYLPALLENTRENVSKRLPVNFYNKSLLDSYFKVAQFTNKSQTLRKKQNTHKPKVRKVNHNESRNCSPGCFSGSQPSGHVVLHEINKQSSLK